MKQIIIMNINWKKENKYISKKVVKKWKNQAKFVKIIKSNKQKEHI